MNQHSKRIKLNLEKDSYEIVIGDNLLNEIGNELLKLGFRKSSKILLVSNPEIKRLYGKEVIDSLNQKGFKTSICTIEAGESHKTPESISLIHNAAYENNLERGSLMIALGGGVIGDMTGFAAATWLRGISLVQVPTSLLAMVDASVGGKTGVNLPGGKNLIGSFHQPKLVLIDITTLKTLQDREFRAGMAEVIKYGVIGDKDLFSSLEKISSLITFNEIDSKNLLNIIEKSVLTKVKIVEKDQFEGGIRAILNYGHTFGHVVETLCGYGTWLHGEAVSIGMNTVGELALKRNIWSKRDLNRQKDLIKKAGLPTNWPELNPEEVIDVLKSDKKVKDNNIHFVIPKRIGSVELINDIDIQYLKEFLYQL